MTYRIVKITHKGNTRYSIEKYSSLKSKFSTVVGHFKSLQEAEEAIEKTYKRILEQREKPLKEVIREFELPRHLTNDPDLTITIASEKGNPYCPFKH